MAVTLKTNTIKKGVNISVIAVKITTEAGTTNQTVKIAHGLSFTPDFAFIQEITPVGDKKVEDRIMVQHTGDIGNDAKIDADGTYVRVFVLGNSEDEKVYRGLLIVGRCHSIIK